MQALYCIGVLLAVGVFSYAVVTAAPADVLVDRWLLILLLVVVVLTFIVGCVAAMKQLNGLMAILGTVLIFLGIIGSFFYSAVGPHSLRFNTCIYVLFLMSFLSYIFAFATNMPASNDDNRSISSENQVTLDIEYRTITPSSQISSVVDDSLPNYQNANLMSLKSVLANSPPSYEETMNAKNAKV